MNPDQEGMMYGAINRIAEALEEIVELLQEEIIATTSHKDIAARKKAWAERDKKRGKNHQGFSYPFQN